MRAAECADQLCTCKLRCHSCLYLHPLMWQEQHIPTDSALPDVHMGMTFHNSRNDETLARSCLTGLPAIDERLVEKGAAAMASMGPMAIPTSAVPRAAKSFRPSPQNMTVCCCPCETTSSVLAAQHLCLCLLSMPCR